MFKGFGKQPEPFEIRCVALAGAANVIEGCEIGKEVKTASDKIWHFFPGKPIKNLETPKGMDVVTEPIRWSVLNPHTPFLKPVVVHALPLKGMSDLMMAAQMMIPSVYNLRDNTLLSAVIKEDQDHYSMCCVDLTNCQSTEPQEEQSKALGRFANFYNWKFLTSQQTCDGYTREDVSQMMQNCLGSGFDPIFKEV